MRENAGEMPEAIEEDLLATVDSGEHIFAVAPVKDTVILQAMANDQKAFETLFMGTYRYVFATARKFLSNDQDIYDAIQDTYLKVYKNLSRL